MVKRNKICVGLIILTLIVLVASFASSNYLTYNSVLANEESISTTVIGESSMWFTPDTAEVYVSINNINSSAKEANDKVLNMYNDAKNALVALGISEEDIKTNSFSSYENCNHIMPRACSKGHNVTLNFSYKVKDINLVQNSIDSLLSVGITNIHSINYSLQDTSSAYNQVLKEALQKAYTKAQALLGKEQIVLKSVKEENAYCYAMTYRDYTQIGNEDFNQKVQVTARVEACFE